LNVSGDAQGAWTVQDPDTQPGGALSILAQGFGPIALNSLGASAGQLGWGGADDANPAEGSALVSEASGAQPQLILLWRFDILYAVNNAAARAFPQLPRANAAEQSLAMSLAKEMSIYQG
jgi:hypothetical protein